MREALVEAWTTLIDTVRGWCRTQNHRLPTGDTSTFVSHGRALFEKIGVVIPA
jgi:deferrochelatase/peroxidase EfeB